MKNYSILYIGQQVEVLLMSGTGFVCVLFLGLLVILVLKLAYDKHSRCAIAGMACSYNWLAKRGWIADITLDFRL